MTYPTKTYAVVPYDDGSGPRLEVSKGLTFTKADGGSKTVKIAGVGGDVLVHEQDVNTLIAALRAYQHDLDLNEEDA